MPFFKKSKSNKDSAAAQRSESKIKKDIAQMDKELDLDQQIDDLTAKLNLSPKDELETPQESKISAALPGAIGSINQSIEKFVSPAFKTSEKDVKPTIDVTSESTIDEDTVDKNTLDKDLPSFELEHPTPDSGRMNMAEMRMDVARISADIQGGEELYRRALQRVEGLMGQVEKAEVDFSVLNRLEPENRRLKARLRTAQSELEGNKSKLSLITADLEDHQERLDEKTVQYEQTRIKLVSATKTLHEYDRALKQSKADVERHSLSLERNKTALNVEGRENKVLREKISELSEAVDARQNEFLEASKMVESLRVDCEEYRKQAEAYRSEAQDMRITLNTAKRQNNAMKGEMLALHDDIKTFKTQYEFNVIGREDQVTDLEVQLATLTKELDVKKDVSEKREAELSQIRRIRAQQDIERDRLEKALSAAKAELADTIKLRSSENSEQVSLLKKDISEMQADLRRRDELANENQKEIEALRRQLTSADLEREKLQTQLEIQSKERAKAEDNSPISDLEAQIEKLTEQLKIKDEIVQSAAHDLTTLRKDRETQTQENKRLSNLINDQTYQLESAQKALLESKQNETELGQRYKDVAAALSVNSKRRQPEQSASPDIRPDISDDLSDLGEDDIADRILDYKFGISDKIV